MENQPWKALDCCRQLLGEYLNANIAVTVSISRPTFSPVSVASTVSKASHVRHLTSCFLFASSQPSDSYAFDGGSGFSKNMEEQPIIGDNDLLFAPAAPTENLKQRREKKRREKNATPKAKNSAKTFADDSEPSPTTNNSAQSKTKSPEVTTKPATPPPLPPKGVVEDDEDIWYAKWWIACFPDSFKNLMPKR